MGWSFQIHTCGLRRRKSHLKLMKQVYSIHMGSLSTTRQRAGSNTGSCHVPWSQAMLLGSLPGVAHSQSILSSTQEATLTPHRPWDWRSALTTGSVPQQSLGVPSLCLHLCLHANNSNVGPAWTQEQAQTHAQLMVKTKPEALSENSTLASLALLPGTLSQAWSTNQSWCKEEIPAKTVGLLSSMSISLPEQEPHH